MSKFKTFLRIGETDVKIKEYTFEMGNDFSAILQCEHCASTQTIFHGYHDDFYHNKVIPSIKCKSCGLDSHRRKTENDEGVNGI